jgi:hypothetical protein
MINETVRKINFIRRTLVEFNLSGIHLRGVDWFSWLSGGGSSTVIMTSEIGIAEILITAEEAWVLTNTIENQRLISEELPDNFSVTDFPWQDRSAQEKFVKQKIKTGALASDKPAAGEVPLPESLILYKLKMQTEEVARYREVGKSAAEAMTEAMTLAKPDWSENQLAGAGAKALWSRGLEPTLILVAGSERGQKYRHPRAKTNKLNDSAMMVFCARGFGLYANLTRFVFFRDLSISEKKTFSDLKEIEGQVLAATRPGQNLSDLYSVLLDTYKAMGYDHEINRHHQGGPTGYLSREFIAGPKNGSVYDLNSDIQVQAGMTFAWNPSLPGAKVEDTVLIHDKDLEILTHDSNWPSRVFNGLKRPDVWVRK